MKKNNMNDEEIMQIVSSAKNGDHEAFSAVADIFLPHLNKIISSLSVPASDVDDARQEGLIALSNAVREFDGEKASFSTFAYTCMKNSVISFLRRKPKINEIFVGDFTSLDEGENSFRDFETPEKKLLEKEAMNLLLGKLSENLSAFELEVLLMNCAGEKTNTIAEKLGKDKKSVDNALFRSREKISKLF